MNRTVTVITPENITITYQLAGVATRFMAMLIDLLIQLLLLILAMLLVNLFQRVPFGINHLVGFFFFIMVFSILFVYPVFFEMIWAGRTPGKRLFGLRVLRDGGYPINIISSAIRNLLRFIDFGIIPFVADQTLVLWGLPGLMSVFFSGSYKRIGDYAAGTVVIRETRDTLLASAQGVIRRRPEIEALLPYIRNIDRLSVEDYRIVRRFTGRRAGLDLMVQAAVAESVARPLLQKMQIDIPLVCQLQYADVLEAIERRYIEENGIL